MAKDPARPFRVVSDTAVVRAVGTEFNIYRKAGQTIVTVVQGKVVVSQDSATNRSASAVSGNLICIGE